MRWRALILATAALAAVVPTPHGLVERYYSGLLYPLVQRGMTAASNLTGFALFDALIAGALAFWVARFYRDLTIRRGGSRGRVLLGVVLRTATMAAAFYLIFLIMWGLNYRRVPLDQKLELDAASISPHAAIELAETSVAEVNRLYSDSRPGAWPDAAAEAPSLEQGFAEAQRSLGTTALARPGRPKRTWLNWYFRRTAIDAMTDPYFLETLVLSDLLPMERPMVVAHEWAHLAGYADEGEANFVGWLTCLRSTPAARYSAWLFLYSQTVRGLAAPERLRIGRTVEAGPRSDLRAIAHRFQTDVSPAMSAAGWRVYDSYLKANRVERGGESYADVVRLVLGTRLGARLTAGSTRRSTAVSATSG